MSEARQIAGDVRAQLEFLAGALILPSAEVMEASARQMESAASSLEVVSREIRIHGMTDMGMKADLTGIRQATGLIGLLLRQAIDLQTGWMAAGEYTPGGDTRVDWPAHRLIAEG